MSDPLESLKQLKYQPQPGRWERLATQPPKRRSSRPLLVIGGLLAAALVAAGVFFGIRPSISLPTEIVSNGASRLTALTPRWLEVGTGESATVTIADIGTVTVDEGSRVRLKQTGPTQHRLELERGTLHALVTAPPRLFVVDTPTASAIDLGCAYTLEVTDAGSRLTVTSGLVSLAGKGREVTVLAGMRAMSAPNRPPTTPVSLDASAALVDAIDRFDRVADVTALDAAVLLARAQDAATLWHLLPVAPPAQRAALIAQLTAFVAPPAGWADAAATDASSALMQAWWAAIIAFEPQAAPTK
ncbi:MAG: FecR family protein [Myxococcales bacterium]|nr:FecR family protein [Myxococcales bacterium]